MDIYIRKIDKQCINKQISVTKGIVEKFFDDAAHNSILKFIGKKSSFNANVTMLLSTDPRLGGDIKDLIQNEGGMRIDDLMVIYKRKNDYMLEIVNNSDARYQHFFDMFQFANDRHLVFHQEESIPFEQVISEDDIDENFLASELKNMYDDTSTDKAVSIHLFGIKYGKIIRKKGFSINNIIAKSGINTSYLVEVNKGIKLSQYVGIYETSKPKGNIFKYISSHKGENLIVYGTPGCGKSYHVDHDYLGKQGDGTYSGKGYEKQNVIRTTFYQDYSNTDFVGQILPMVKEDKSVEYVFNPGPFTKALIQAIKSPDSKVALVIEEINRGNAASIFGDIFQLLDRKNGVSEYGIVNVALIDYLNKYNFGTEESPIKYVFDEIKIPGNMWIYATMNTSDQNVFTLDSAFTRRWKKERMCNSFDGKAIGGLYVPGMQDVTWEDMVQAINDYILEFADQLQTSEDKQIGVYFVDQNGLAKNTVDAKDKDKVREFANKMMEYLWDDVSKLERDLIFKKDLNSIDKVLAQYEKDGQVFNDNLASKIKSKKATVVTTHEDSTDDGEEN